MIFALISCTTVDTSPPPSAPPTAPSNDTASDTGMPVEPNEPTSICEIGDTLRRCPHQQTTLASGPLTRRAVYYQLPVGEPPAAGWPVAVLFQGSFFPIDTFWEARPDDPFGAWNQVGTVAALLDAGFVVLTPEAFGGSFWNTNIAPWSFAWESSPDHQLMLSLLAAIDGDELGAVDQDRLYASGLSSGGYMTSRMALSYPGRFRALAIHSASWATCAGPLCVLPATLPSDHPPTLFLHGELDTTVPIETMEIYAARLGSSGHETRVVRDPDVEHAWLPVAPVEIVDWFTSHP